LLAALPLLASPAWAAPGAPRPRLALDSHLWPPYYLDDAERPGYVREVLALCLPATGFDARFFPLALGETFSALRSGKLDAHVLAREPERERFVVYGSAPLFRETYRPVVRAGSGIRVAAAADFDRLRLGHVRGLRYTREFHDYVYGRLVAGTAVEGASNEELLRQLVAGRIDVFVGPVATNEWLAERLGVTDRIALLPWEVKSGDYFLAVARESSRVGDPRAFLAAFDGCVEELRADGRLARLAGAYGLR
jgi:polar amino acid transport system substrate-binding protein